MQLVLFWVFAVLMLLFGAAVAYVRERQGRGGLWDASKDQRLPLNGWFSRSPGQVGAGGLGLCAKKPVQEPRRASGARSTEAGRQHCLGLDGAEATHSTRC